MKADHRNYQNGFNFYFDWPVEIAPGVNVPVEIRAFIEPDESVACSDWYVANVYVAETEQEITKDHPIALTISAHCSRAHGKAIDTRWLEWLADHPRKRRA